MNLVYIKEYFINYKFVLKSINITILITLILLYLEFILSDSVYIYYLLLRKEIIPGINDMNMADMYNSYSYIVNVLIRTFPFIKYIIFGLVIISMIIQSKFSKIILIPFILLVIGYSYIFIEIITKYSQNMDIYRQIILNYQYVSVIECIGIILFNVFIFIKYKKLQLNQN